MTAIPCSPGDGCADETPPNFRELQVVDVADVTPRMRRVALIGSDLDRFRHGGLHVRLLIPSGAVEPQWPRLGRNGLLIFPGGERSLALRTYTIRRLDAATGRIAAGGSLTMGGLFGIITRGAGLVCSHLPRRRVDVSALERFV